MMKTTDEELAVAILDDDGKIISMAGQFRAGDAKEYFKALRKNFGE